MLGGGLETYGMTQTRARKSLTAILCLTLIAMAAPQATSGPGTAQVIGTPADDCPDGEIGITANAFAVEQGPPPWREYRLVATGESYDATGAATSQAFSFALTKDEIAGTSRSLEFNSLCGEWDGCIFQLQMQQRPTPAAPWEDTGSSWVSCLNLDTVHQKNCDLLGHCAFASYTVNLVGACTPADSLCNFERIGTGRITCRLCLDGIGVLSGDDWDRCMFVTPANTCPTHWQGTRLGAPGKLCGHAQKQGIFDAAAFVVTTPPAKSLCPTP